MGRHDWYRRTEWTPTEKREFHDRLERSRTSFGKAQYLRIQASCLQDVGKHTEAMELLRQLFERYPDPLQLALAHRQMARGLIAVGRAEEAVNEFRRSLEAERKAPQMATNSWLEYPWFIVTHEFTHLYTEAIEILDEFTNKAALAFPVSRYQYAAILAMIHDQWGQISRAHAFAKSALEAAAADDSGSRRHPGLGLVKGTESEIHKRLLAMTGD